MLEKTLESPLASKEIKVKEINPEYSLEALMLNFQYFGHLIWRANLLEKTLILGKFKGRRRKGQQRMKWFYGIIDSKDLSLGKLWEIVKDRELWVAVVHADSQRVRHNWATEQQILTVYFK